MGHLGSYIIIVEVAENWNKKNQKGKRKSFCLKYTEEALEVKASEMKYEYGIALQNFIYDCVVNLCIWLLERDQEINC